MTPTPFWHAAPTATWFGTGGQESQPISSAARTAVRPSHMPRVLIVEDELFVAWHLETLMREMQLDVCGIEQANDLNPDLVLMDIRLAGRMDGIEAARQIRNRRPDVRIIFITAHNDQVTQSRIAAQVAGARILGKPVSPPRLQAAIAELLPGLGH
jgi:CheY-like chemotaxis protein